MVFFFHFLRFLGNQTTNSYTKTDQNTRRESKFLIPKSNPKTKVREKIKTKLGQKICVIVRRAYIYGRAWCCEILDPNRKLRRPENLRSHRSDSEKEANRTEETLSLPFFLSDSVFFFFFGFCGVKA